MSDTGEAPPAKNIVRKSTPKKRPGGGNSWRQHVLDNGGKSINILLDGDQMEQLRRVQENTGCESITDTIRYLIRTADRSWNGRKKSK